MTNRSAILFFLLLLVVCKYDGLPPPQIYLEGKPIPGTEMHFPQNVNVDKYLYGGEALLPKVSPDGTKLMYSGDILLGSKGLWVMDLTSKQKTLIINDGMNGDWGPDSQWIYFKRYDLQIYKARIDGTAFEQLTSSGTNLYPVCDFNGNRLLYTSEVVGNYGVSMIATNGSNGKLIVPNLGNIPAWYPDQEKFFVFTGQTYDTVGTVLSSFNITWKYGPGISSISPHDSRIVINTISGIYIINPDGTGLKRILPNHLYNNDYHGPIKLWAQNASWHPDGKHIVYEHLAIDQAVETNDGLYIKGTMSFYKVNADSAIMVSNLELNDI